MPAKQVGDAQKLGLALYVGTQHGMKDIILYDAQALKEYLDEQGFFGGLTKKELGEAQAAALDDEMFSHLYAKITVRPTAPGKGYGAKTVANTAAKKGYGPLIYDIGMALVKGLIPDRETVSADARKVWSYYKNNRSDVDAKKLDNIMNPKTKTPKDDAFVYEKEGEESPLNYAYFIKNAPEVSKLLNNHKVFLKNLSMTKAQVDDVFQRAGDRFFEDHYVG